MKEKLFKENIILLIILIFLIIIFFFLLFVRPKLLIIYNNQEVNSINIELNESFKTPTYKVKYLNKNISSKVKVNGSVNTSKVGSYELTYSTRIFIYKLENKVIVNVIDKIPPVITLNGNIESNACSSNSYIEEGYTAIDNYDGDITSQVTIENNINERIYKVKDSSNNEAKVIRKINITDNEGPSIKLKGEENVYILLNDTYKESGYIIEDNCDSEITNIKIDNKVDTTKVGVYTITYTATDSSNNQSSVKRYVYVYNPKTSQNMTGSEKGVIYLTFDDGPSTYTTKILDTLKKYDIKATFFVTSSGSDSAIKREFEEGHTVALHTSTHNYSKVYASVESYFKDLETVQNRVKKITNETPTIIRFPGGSSNTVSKFNKGIMTILTNEVLEKGYHYFDWNVSVEDAGGCTKKKTTSEKENCVYNYFVKGISKSKMNVVLMHDVKSYTASKLDDMIKYALSKGYTFDKITMDTTQIHHKVNN